MPSNISVQEATPIVEGAIKYVRPFKATLKAERNTTLLWGDPVRVLAAPQGGKVRVRARETEGLIAEADLCDQSLLEVYFIEVGQGDSILVHTPADRWILIDAGVANAAQPTRKGAANFLRWKFQRELGQGAEAPIVLDSVVVTHPDTDHYAGLLNVLSGQLEPGGARVPIEIGTLYHNGIGRFAAAPRLGAMGPGEAAAFPAGNHSFAPKDTFLTELLDDRASFEARRSRFSKEFAAYVDVALASAKQVRRLSHADGYLPGYEEGGGLVVRVLGPIAEPLQGGGVGLRAFNGWGGAFDESATRNGHSLMLRLDYGGARILLGGDTNRAGQELLLCYQKPSEFQADVAKGFHHGSEDISTAFLRSVGARVTIFSSGDAEDYYHPRPAAVGAAGPLRPRVRGRPRRFRAADGVLHRAVALGVTRAAGRGRGAGGGAREGRAARGVDGPRAGGGGGEVLGARPRPAGERPGLRPRQRAHRWAAYPVRDAEGAKRGLLYRGHQGGGRRPADGVGPRGGGAAVHAPVSRDRCNVIVAGQPAMKSLGRCRWVTTTRARDQLPASGSTTPSHWMLALEDERYSSPRNSHAEKPSPPVLMLLCTPPSERPTVRWSGEPPSRQRSVLRILKSPAPRVPASTTSQTLLNA